MKEIWKPVAGFEGSYEISNTGIFRSIDRYVSYPQGWDRFFPGKIISPYSSKDGYLSVSFRTGGRKSHHRQIHRMVAEAFCEKQDGCDVVNHIDCDRSNNHFLNLEWTTTAGNSAHMMSMGRANPRRGSKVTTSKLTESDVIDIIHRLTSGETHISISKIYGISDRVISGINGGKLWLHVKVGDLKPPYCAKYPTRFKRLDLRLQRPVRDV